MSIQVALGIVEQDRKNFVVMEVTGEDIQTRFTLSDDKDYEEQLNLLIQGIAEVRSQMRRAKSGLVVVEGVSQDGLGSIQGRPANRPRRTGKQGSRAT